MARPTVAEERREEILAAFERCIVRKGFAETTLADVAEEAGQPRPLVRHFIGNRGDMVSALIERLLERGEAQLKRAAPGEDAEEALDLLLGAVFADAATNIVIMELWHLALRDVHLRKRLSAIYERLVLEVAALGAGASGQAIGRDRAFAAVSTAFGTAFFRHLGVEPPAPGAVRGAVRQLLSANSPLSEEPGKKHA
jgi:AcrR family transcriptional regulator